MIAAVDPSVVVPPEGSSQTRSVSSQPAGTTSAAGWRPAGRSADGFPIAPKIALTFQDGPAAAGQAPSEGRPQDIIDTLRRFRDAGATEFCFDIMTETLPVMLDTMERFAQEVRDKV